MSSLPVLKTHLDGYNQKPNAFVGASPNGRVEIFPTEGGWLGFDAKYAQGDIAPFSD
jgi:hypothetical protein